ncbi:MAG: hypothetical protein UY04_C0015G0041 [Parcubacteria group bacterium GW2011_GWA2_47_7]|nr:MAG: hypothetical protein UY04_C0015G0041 [Parcubacteria group bacterium GW2011_GWA2_47_7]
MPTLFELNQNDNDQLRELINIGVSHAGDTLSIMMGKRVTVSIPHVSIKNASNATIESGFSNEVTVSVLLRVYGLIDGYVLLFFPRKAALHLLGVLSGKKIGDLRALDDFDRSLFQELGNVITGGMLQGLSKFLHIEMMHSVPNVVVDMGGAMLGSVSASMIQLHEEFLSLEVSVCVAPSPDGVVCDGTEGAVGQMYLFMGPSAVRKILDITNTIMHSSKAS